MMTKFQSYKEYKAAMEDLRMRKNKAIAKNDIETQKLCASLAMKIIDANAKWGHADRAWAAHTEEGDDFDND